MVGNFEDFIRQLNDRLRAPLPGREAQVKMAPYPVDENRFKEDASRPSRPGGVMILLYPHNGDIYLPLMKRPTYNGAHSGQVSFPGGKFEQYDLDLRETALRETEEEIGVRGEQIEVLGSLSELFIIASNFKVVPTVGYTLQRPKFIPDATEVEQVMEVSLRHLRDVTNRNVKEMHFGDYSIQSPYFDVEGHVVWGATAMMLSELLQVVDELAV